MSYQLIIAPEIEQEIAEEFESFDNIETALAFIHDLELLFERIVDRPLQFPVIYASTRRALLRRHDYSVFLRARREAIARGHSRRDSSAP